MSEDNGSTTDELPAVPTIYGSNTHHNSAPDAQDVILADLAELKLIVGRLFEQLTWIAGIMNGVLGTLPPPMRAQILNPSQEG